MTSLWAVHNTLRGWTLYDLSEADLQLLSQVLTVNELKLSLITEKGSAAWKPFSEKDFPKFFSKKNEKSEGYPELASSGSGPDSDIDTGFFKTQKSAPIIPRLYQRFEVVVKCSVVSSREKFETESVNVSEGGLQFRDVLPEWLAGYFHVHVHSPSGGFKVLCSIVEDQKEKRRVQIVSEENEQDYLDYKSWVATLK